MKTIIFSLAFLLIGAVAPATPSGRFRITGIVTSFTANLVEVKTEKALLLIPKNLISKKQIKSGDLFDIDVTKADLDKIKAKQ